MKEKFLKFWDWKKNKTLYITTFLLVICFLLVIAMINMSDTAPQSQSTSAVSLSNVLSESTNQSILDSQPDTGHTEYQTQQAQDANTTTVPKASSNNTAGAKSPTTEANKSNYSPAAKPDNSVGSASNETAGQRNAVQKAKSYISHSAFSREGLIAQLEFEKFSHEDAVYGADHCGANWNEQALKKAKSYLNHSAFSYLGLIDQLEFEKFTSEQARYAVDRCGADWNEQAAKKAKSYLSHSSFSREGLIAQLEFEKFTHEQAVYGVEANGL